MPALRRRRGERQLTVLPRVNVLNVNSLLSFDSSLLRHGRVFPPERSGACGTQL